MPSRAITSKSCAGCTNNPLSRPATPSTAGFMHKGKISQYPQQSARVVPGLLRGYKPRNAAFATDRLLLGLIYADARRDNAAVEQFKKTLDMDSNFASAHGNLSGTCNGSLALRKMPNP